MALQSQAPSEQCPNRLLSEAAWGDERQLGEAWARIGVLKDMIHRSPVEARKARGKLLTGTPGLLTREDSGRSTLP
ncbi:MAG TPA: hypothetical protein VIV60_04645, partial [Polyangiaceae bacterium]